MKENKTGSHSIKTVITLFILLLFVFCIILAFLGGTPAALTFLYLFEIIQTKILI